MQTLFSDIYSQLAHAIVTHDLNGKKRFDDNCIARATYDDYTGPKSRFLSLDARELINRHLEAFEQRGVLRLRQKSAVSLLIYTADIIQGKPLNNLYSEVGMISSRDVQQYVSEELLLALDTEDIHSAALRDFAKECIVQAPIGRKGSIFAAGPRESCMQENRAAIRALKGADAVLQMEAPELIRHISIRAYGNSKAFTEPLLNRKINAILSMTAPEHIRTRYMQEKDAGDNPTWCSAFGVRKNPYSEVFEGDFDVYTGDDVLRIRCIPFSFWSDHADKYERILINAETIITIENETAYTDYYAPRVVKCYTGGFPSHFLVYLLRKIARDNPDIQWLHWSDMDPSGFEIFSFLREHVTTKYVPYRMDKQTYDMYSGMALPDSLWTENDSKLIYKYLNDNVFSEIAHVLADTHRKLEQEAICNADSLQGHRKENDATPISANEGFPRQ